MIKFRKIQEAKDVKKTSNTGQFPRKGVEKSKDICKSYLELHTIKAVAEKFSLHPKTIAKILKENKVKIKGRGFAAQKVTNNPFKGKEQRDIDYWIGFIAGDGCLAKNKYAISIGSNDLEIIENFKDFIGEGLGITSVVRGEIIHYTAKFSHKESHDFLISKGLTPAKSLTLKFTNPINWDVLRGLFDADGSFSQQRFKITTGSMNMVIQLSEFCKKHNIEFSINRKSPKSTTYDFYFKGGKLMLDKVYDNMYINSKYLLTRKKEQIGRHIQ